MIEDPLENTKRARPDVDLRPQVRLMFAECVRWRVAPLRGSSIEAHVVRIVRASVAALALLALAIGARAHAQTNPAFYNPASCALPERYSLTALVDDLGWNDIAIATETVVRAHRLYSVTIDGLLPDCVPFGAPLAEGTNTPLGIRASDAELAKLRSHQRTLTAASDAAEEALFDELARAAGTLPGDGNARLEQLRARRALARFVYGLQRRCSIRGFHDIPREFTCILSVSGDLRQLPPRVRIAISAAIDSKADTRRRAWASAETSIDEAIASTAVMQRETSTSEGGYGDPPMKHLPLADVARLLRVELDTLRAIERAVPEAAARVQRSEIYLAPNLWWPFEPSAAIPLRGKNQSLSLSAFATLMARNPAWNAATQASIRPMLAAWIQEDGALVSEWLDSAIRALEAEAADGGLYIPASESLDAARTALARDKLAQLTSLLGVDWLVAGGIMPLDSAALGPQTPSDTRDFGAILHAAQPGIAAPALESLADVQRAPASLGMTPVWWRDSERDQAIDLLALDRAQLLVATQVLADAADEWAMNVEPLARESRLPKQRLNESYAARQSNGESNSTDIEARIAIETDVVGAIAQRRACWTAARAIDDRLFSNLETALGPTHEDGKNYLQSLRLVRAREAAIMGSRALIGSNDQSYALDVASVALALRATPQERALLRAALARQCAVYLPARIAEWEATLTLQEEYELLGLRSATRMRDTEGKAQVPPSAESFREFRALAEDTRALIVRMKQSDHALLGRMQADLPDYLGHRLRWAVHVMGTARDFAGITSARVNVLFALGRIQPDAVPEAEAAFNHALDAWETWAEPIVEAINLQFPSMEGENPHQRNTTDRRRVAMLQLVLAPAGTDRLNQALSTIAAKAPLATARRIPQLARFAPAEAEQPPRAPAQP